MKSQDFLFNREIDAWHSFTVSTDSEGCYSPVLLHPLSVWLDFRFFYQVIGLGFFPEVIFVMGIFYFPSQVIQTD